METSAFRSVVSAIGLLAAVTVSLAVPAGYLLLRRSGATEAIGLIARVNAVRIERRVGRLPPTIDDIIPQLQPILVDGTRPYLRQSLFDADGKALLAAGSPPEWPTIERSAPVDLPGSPGSRLLVSLSLRPLLGETSLVAAFSVAFGALLYGLLRLFPLWMVDRALQALEIQNRRFDSALNNMSQGLCFFDGEQRLIVCNARYSVIYGLEPEKIRQGMTLREIVDLRYEAGSAPDMPRDDYISWRTGVHMLAGPTDNVVALANGRFVSIHHHPMPDGGWVATHDDVTERVRSEAQIRHMARHDVVTELPNRLLFRERMEAALTRARDGEPSAMLCIDLDRFKSVNDTLGHPVGDALLKAVSERLRSCVRAIDVVARLGGDEFAVIQAKADHPGAVQALADRLVRVIGTPFEIDGNRIVIGATIGIAMAPSDGLDPDELLQKADMALYRAKAQGRGTWTFFRPEMIDEVMSRRALEIDLRRALAAGEFEVWYQPIVALADRSLIGFEALVRWRHPERGIVMPGAFMPFAEEIDLVVPIGEWVLRRACADAAAWPDNLRLAVNISPRQLRRPVFPATVADALGSADLSPDRLELEITESVLLAENHVTMDALHRLRQQGIRISLDDFGVGYSSLSYLRAFPFDKIKIDQSFVRDITVKADSAAIVRAVTTLGRSLGMTTTAEGVETEAQLDLLRADGCIEAQGYLISPPRPASEVAGLMARLAAAPNRAAA